MKSVGEVMAIGRTFKESLQKALRSLEIGHAGFEPPERAGRRGGHATRCGRRSTRRGPGARGRSPRRCGAASRSRSSTAARAIDPWFLRNLGRDRRDGARPRARRDERRRTASRGCAPAKQAGFSDARLATLWGTREDARARAALARGRAARSTSASTPAPPSSRRTRPTSTRPTRTSARRGPTDRRKIMILGGGPNRIGQGIEFDYCCVHAAFALREAGFETIMVNCNPETVSTDYDTSDRLYFEPLTLEDVLEIVETREARGRDRAVRRADAAQARGGARAAPACRSSARSPDAIDRAEDRERFEALLEELGLRAPAGRHRAQRRRRPRPSPRGSATRCWCGRPTCSAAARWRSCTTWRRCASYMRYAVKASPERPGARRPLPRRRDRGGRRRHLPTASAS